MTKKLFILIIIITAIIQYGCKKNESGPPVITGVRVVDSALRDSLFTQAMPGAEIVILGTNLGGVQAVFFNDTAASFNPVYNTGSNIIIVIPATAQTAATNPGVPSSIRLITNHGMATYSFSLYLPPPSISSLSLNDSGTVVTINGNNFQGIKKITFPVPGNDTAVSYTVNKTYTQITAVIPPGNAFNDSVRVFCTFGTGSFSYPPPMIINSVSNENATAGTTITVNGTNFIGIHQVMFPGGIPGTNFQSMGANQFTVTVPAGITTSDSLRLVGVLGTTSSSQLFDSYITHPSPGYLCNFDNQWASDNTGYLGWTGTYDDATAAAASYPGNTGGVGVLLQGSPMPGSTSAGSQGNAGWLQLNPFPWVANTAASTSGYSMKFEVFVANPWTAGEIWISVGGWYGWNSYSARYAPWSTATGGTYQTTGWVTVTIPLSQFLGGNPSSYALGTNPFEFNTSGAANVPASTFASYPSTAVAFALVNDQPSPSVPANTLNIAIDNVRIVKGQ